MERPDAVAGRRSATRPAPRAVEPGAAARRDAAALLQLVLDTSESAIWALDPDERLTLANRAFARLVGRSEGELLGRPFAELLPRERRGHDRALVAGASANGRPAALETDLLRADGTRVAVRGSYAPLLEDGRLRAVVGAVEDVTERRRLEDELRQAQKMEAVGLLAGGIAHDFNNIMTIIDGLSGALLEALPAESAEHGQALGVRDAAQRATALTRQLLAFSRRQILRPTVVDVGEVVRRLEPLLRRALREDIALDLRLAPDLPPIRVDAPQIDQILVNLILNARDALPQGGRISIETSLAELGPDTRAGHTVVPGPYVLVTVADDGTGMDAATREHAFEPFFSTKVPGQGTGLGLSTVYGIVKQSGGYVYLESEPGRGTSVRTYLPVADAVPESSATAPEPDVTRLPAALAVLLVVEDAGMRTTLRLALERAGCTVHAAADGPAALALARTLDSIDLLVADVAPAGAAGGELAERLGADLPGLRTLYLASPTALPGAGGELVGTDPPMLHEPFTSEDLLRAIARLTARPAA